MADNVIPSQLSSPSPRSNQLKTSSGRVLQLGSSEKVDDLTIFEHVIPAGRENFSPSQIKELRENKKNQPDDRPLTIIIFPEDDWNGAFDTPGLENIDALMKESRVLFYRVSNKTDLFKIIETAGKKQKISNFIIGGHGTANSLRLGKGNNNQALLTLADRHYFAKVAPYFTENCTIILKSCSTGQGRNQAINLANIIKEAIPQCEVMAPTEPASGLAIYSKGRLKMELYFTAENGYQDRSYRATSIDRSAFILTFNATTGLDSSIKTPSEGKTGNNPFMGVSVNGGNLTASGWGIGYGLSGEYLFPSATLATALTLNARVSLEYYPTNKEEANVPIKYRLGIGPVLRQAWGEYNSTATDSTKPLQKGFSQTMLGLNLYSEAIPQFVSSRLTFGLSGSYFPSAGPTIGAQIGIPLSWK